MSLCCCMLFHHKIIAMTNTPMGSSRIVWHWLICMRLTAIDGIIWFHYCSFSPLPPSNTFSFDIWFDKKIIVINWLVVIVMLTVPSLHQPSHKPFDSHARLQRSDVWPALESSWGIVANPKWRVNIHSNRKKSKYMFWKDSISTGRA